jgi:hypothetical protein
MRCPLALLRRGSLVGECYSSVGSRLSVWCFRLRRLAILGGSRCCAVSCISGLTCSLIVRCNFVYVLSIFVDNKKIKYLFILVTCRSYNYRPPQKKIIKVL